MKNLLKILPALIKKRFWQTLNNATDLDREPLPFNYLYRMDIKRPKPGYLWSIFTMRCPRCRRGPMFKQPNPFKKIKLSHIFDMYEHCPECGQKYDLEYGFWYGTGYVSYALAVAISVATFVAWMVLVGVSTEDNRVFYWLGFNGLFLVLIQPWLMRLSRVIYLYFFISYDENYKQTKPVEFDHKQ